MDIAPVCLEEGCAGKVECRGLCGRHYKSWRRRGKKLPPKKRVPRVSRQESGRRYRQKNKPLQISGTINCYKCSRVLPADNFDKDSSRPNGRSASCKLCRENYRLISRYGISSKDAIAILERQKYQCRLCDEKLVRWHIDHDHSCCPEPPACGNCVRGILCQRCNWGLGNFRDNPRLLQRAIEYLTPAPVDLGLITHVCPCGSNLWKIAASFNDYELATYSLEMYCIDCSTKAIAPTPIDKDE